MLILTRRVIFWSLIVLFVIHSFLVFTIGTEEDKGETLLTKDALNGKLVYQKYNCTACHQLYGLGGYMGPDLTNVMSKQGIGELYVRAFLQNGTQRMPNFHLSEEEIIFLVAYLKYVDKTGISPVKKFEINLNGTVTQK
ncbi:MAG: cytochrome c [Bacteroidetes bacterium]|nr:MAG: cytochrome c [Bacteroidota bacterium]